MGIVRQVAARAESYKERGWGAWEQCKQSATSELVLKFPVHGDGKGSGRAHGNGNGNDEWF